MNRPKRLRGLATDPGVQRKAPRTVIQRENKPKGPRLEEQFEWICTAPVAPKDQRKFSLMHLVTRVHWENNQSMTMNRVIHITLRGELQVFADESLAACISEANRRNAERGYTNGVRVVECEDGHRMTADDCKAAARSSL